MSSGPGVGTIEGGAIGGDADNRCHSRAIASHGSLQPPASTSKLIDGKLRGRRRGARDQVGDAAAELEQGAALGRVQAARGEAGGGQRRPEPIAGPRKVKTRGARIQPGVDSAEQHVQSRRDDVGNRAIDRGAKVVG